MFIYAQPPAGRGDTLYSVASDQDNTDEKQTRVNAMIDEFRAARQRRLVTGGVTRGVRPPAPVEAEPEPQPVAEPLLPRDEEEH